MKNRNRTLTVFICLPAFLFLVGCKKQFDLPPVKDIETGTKINIAGIKAKYVNAVNYRFRGDSNLYCVITADELSGNLYKDVYVKDATGALHVKFISSGGFYIGDSIRINLQGVLLNEYSKLIQLDSVDSEKNIVKLSSGYNPSPVAITITQLLANTAATNSVQSKLIRLDNVEFVGADQDRPYADANGKTTGNRVLKSCDGQTITVRTSGYASFASQKTPTGNGSFVGIASQFGNNIQLLLRNAGEVNMTNTLCGISTTSSNGNYLSKNFDDNNMSSSGWSSQNVKGNISWTTATFGSQTYAKISNFVSGSNLECETWLISPSINLSMSGHPSLSFQNAYKYTGAQLEVYVSTDYSAGLPATAKWQKLMFNLSGGNYVFTNSGNVSLDNYKQEHVRIAFTYSGSNVDGSTWELDDVLVKEN